ncbi:hypothetical protein [Streptomyces sp. NPDC088246]|uniref:hypothetical protein n=1 Tax=Streptomyces sp. NPDC088246 TaxID=3365842 RepID=UPI00383091BA
MGETFINFRGDDQPGGVGYGKTVESGFLLWQRLQSADDGEAFAAADELVTDDELEERLAALEEVTVPPLPDDIEGLSDSSRFLRDGNNRASAREGLDPADVRPAGTGIRQGYFAALPREFAQFHERRQDSWAWYAELDLRDPHAAVRAALSSAQEFIAGTSYDELQCPKVRTAARSAGRASSDHSFWVVPWRQEEGLRRKNRAKKWREVPQSCSAWTEQRPYLFVIFVSQLAGSEPGETGPVTSWLDCSGPSMREVPAPDAIRGHGAIVVSSGCNVERDQSMAIRIAAIQLPANLYPVTAHSEELRRSWEEMWRPGILQFVEQLD